MNFENVLFMMLDIGIEHIQNTINIAVKYPIEYKIDS